MLIDRSLCSPKTWQNDEDVGGLYAASIYWSTMTVTSIGYGDIHPASSFEQVMCTLVMLLSSVAYAYVIASFCSVLTSLDPAKTEFRQMIDHLNKFIAMHHLSADMSSRLREYFFQTRHLQRQKADLRLLNQMSPDLQGEVTVQINTAWLERVTFLRECEPAMIVQVALRLQGIVYAPGELIPGDQLHILQRGVCVRDGRVRLAGTVWGEDMILSNAALMSSAPVRAITFAQVQTLRRRDLFAVTAMFPRMQMIIRKVAIRIALRREFIRQARANARDRDSCPHASRRSESVCDKLGEGVATRPPPSRGDTAASRIPARQPGASCRAAAAGVLLSRPYSQCSDGNDLQAQPANDAAESISRKVVEHLGEQLHTNQVGFAQLITKTHSELQQRVASQVNALGARLETRLDTRLAQRSGTSVAPSPGRRGAWRVAAGSLSTATPACSAHPGLIYAETGLLAASTPPPGRVGLSPLPAVSAGAPSELSVSGRAYVMKSVSAMNGNRTQ